MPTCPEFSLSAAEGRSRKACGIATLRAQPLVREGMPYAQKKPTSSLGKNLLADHSYFP